MYTYFTLLVIVTFMGTNPINATYSKYGAVVTKNYFTQLYPDFDGARCLRQRQDDCEAQGRRHEDHRLVHGGGRRFNLLYELRSPSLLKSSRNSKSSFMCRNGEKRI